MICWKNISHCDFSSPTQTMYKTLFLIGHLFDNLNILILCLEDLHLIS